MPGLQTIYIVQQPKLYTIFSQEILQKYVIGIEYDVPLFSV
jgi:hypothetical protein